MNQSLKMNLCLVALSLMSVGCTRFVILFKPPAQLDPMPKKNVKVVSDPVETAEEELSWNIKGVLEGSEATKAEALEEGNVNLKVAILSTGVDYNHEDLAGQISVNAAEITDSNAINPSVNQIDDDEDGLVDNIVGWDVVDNDGLAFDRHGAGTAVAGIIAAKANGVGVQGLVKKVNLFPIRYINENGQTNPPMLAEALRVAILQKPDVVFIQNMEIPFGGEMRDGQVGSVEKHMISTYLQKLGEMEVPVVIGAGDSMNEFKNTTMGADMYKYPNVIVVASTNKDGELALLSNRGQKEVHLAAPGDKVYTTLPKNTYGEVRGSAFAAAHVAGALVLAKSKFGERLSLKDHILPALSDYKSLKPNRKVEFMVRSGANLDIPNFLNGLSERL